mmetsp:Transcript_14872/g.21915  ORF Transcript_14872/g.21915 Transcript_14872/m.21915 type:complete len:234 (-) Transcript_14872:1601-2302(-)
MSCNFWSGMVLLTLNSSTVWFWNTCFTHCTTYSVSLSVSHTGCVDLNTRPRSASSGIWYRAAAGSSPPGAPPGAAEAEAAVAVVGAGAPSLWVWAEGAGAAGSSTTGRVDSCRGCPALPPGWLWYALRERSRAGKLRGRGSSSRYSAIPLPEGLSPSWAGSSVGAPPRPMSSSFSKTLMATAARSRTSSFSSRRERCSSTLMEGRREGTHAANFARADTAAALTTAFSRMMRL